jgi:hypothetical protein
MQPVRDLRWSTLKKNLTVYGNASTHQKNNQGKMNMEILELQDQLLFSKGSNHLASK